MIGANIGERRIIHPGVCIAVDDPLVFKTLQSLELSGLTKSAEFHEMIIKAIILRDSKRAGNLMREHISQGFDVIQNLF